MSLVLVMAATLLVQTIIRLQRQQPGFRQDHLLLAHVYIPPARYKEPEAITRFCDAFSARVRALPGVADASMTTGFPPAIGWRQVFTVPGAPAGRLEDLPSARFAAVDTHYVRTLGIPFRTGRDFTDGDGPMSPVVAIVNEQFVHQYFPDKDPVGRTVHQGPPPGLLAPSLQSFGGGTRDMTIIGVVRDFVNNGVGKPPAPQILMLFRQQPSQNFGFKDIVVRTAGNPEAIVPALNRELKALDADIPLGEIRTMETNMGDGAADTRMTTTLLTLFAALGTILAVIGAYGVVAYLVAQRTSELGVRMALGAARSDILWLVLRSGIWIGAGGVGLGLIGAYATRRLLSSRLYGSTALDPAVTFGAALLMLCVVMIATAIPARRAARVDPVTALRSE